MNDLFAGEPRPTSLDDRRRRPRRGGHDEHQVTVIDGLGAGERHGCVYREVTAESASVLVRADLRAGQRVRIQQLTDGMPVGAPQQGEIVRARPLSAGRWDLLVEFHRPAPEAPKMSESQRRHERRLARLARVENVVAAKSI